MPGKVFISCGQKPPNERRVAVEVKHLLESEFNLSCYLAFTIQSLEDIMTITRELRSSDYYLFIDFLRGPDRPQDFPMSLFTHQELALAHFLGFSNFIALQQQGVPLEGFLRYVLSNPEVFTDEHDLMEKIRRLVREKGWSPEYSRNLIVEQIGFTGPIQYSDHTGTFFENVWQVRVRNRRPDAAAISSVCILDYIIRSDGARIESPDRSHVKWAGQIGYDRTILPQDYGDIDLFSIHAERPGLFLHSLRDTPRSPVMDSDGQYQLFYKLFSQGFPIVEFGVSLDLHWTAPSPSQWATQTTATLFS